MKITFLQSAFAIPFLALLPACGSSGAGSCTITSTMAAGYTSCVNYTGSSWTSSSVQTACSAISGTYASGSCASGNGGSCAINSGQPSEIKYFYTIANGGSAAALMTACTALGGTYAP